MAALASTSEHQPLGEDTETQQDSEITNFLKTLSGEGAGALSDDQIESIRLCCRFALEITPQQIESLLETSFSYLFDKGIRVSTVVTRDDAAEDGTPNRIDPEDLLYFMLKRIGYDMPDDLSCSTSPNDNDVYKQIDIILTLATTVMSMSKSDYNKFKRFHTEQNGGVLRRCNIKSRSDLVCRLLEKKPLHEEEDISIVFDWLQVSGCANCEKELRDYYKRHHIKVSVPLKTRCRLVTVTVSVILLLFSITSTILAIFLVTSAADVNVKDPQNKTYPIGLSTTIKLDCFDTSITDLVDVTAIVLDNATIYAIPEDDISACPLLLPYINLNDLCIPESSTGIHPLPIPVSYNTCFQPIYTAKGGGTIHYSIDLVNRNPDRVSCAMRLFVFSNDSANYISYTNAARDPQDDPSHFINRLSSDCVGSNGTHSFSITLPSNSLLYFVLAVVNQTMVNVNVSGNISAYSNTARYRGDECHLTQSNKNCSIMINPEKSRYNRDVGCVCLFGNSTYAYQGKLNLFTTFITRRVYLQKYWIPLIPLGVFTLAFLLLLFLVILYYLRECYKRRKRIAKAAK